MANIGDLDRLWEPADPRRDRALIPYTDNDTTELIDQAAVTLVLLRAPMWLGDAGPTISVLVSLAAETDSLVFDAVADAKDQGYTWAQIATRLATTAATARRRYAPYTRWRNTIEAGAPITDEPTNDATATRCARPQGTDGLDPAGPVLADAIVALVVARGQVVGDALAALEAHLDMIDQGHAELAGAVAEARAQGYSWGHIAGVLSVSRADAIRRYNYTDAEHEG